MKKLWPILILLLISTSVFSQKRRIKGRTAFEISYLRGLRHNGARIGVKYIPIKHMEVIGAFNYQNYTMAGVTNDAFDIHVNAQGVSPGLKGVLYAGAGLGYHVIYDRVDIRSNATELSQINQRKEGLSTGLSLDAFIEIFVNERISFKADIGQTFIVFSQLGTLSHRWQAGLGLSIYLK